MSGLLCRSVILFWMISVSFVVRGTCDQISGFQTNHSSFGISPVSTPDSVIHSPRKAALLSAILPGAGQFYNKKYWKIPLVYAAGATGGYFIYDNLQSYQRFKMAYIYRTDEDPATIDDLPKVSDQQLKVYRDAYRRDAEFAVILTSLAYIIQILDATVDAHLFDFDVSDNISLSMRPAVQPLWAIPQSPLVPSVTFCFSLRTNCEKPSLRFRPL